MEGVLACQSSSLNKRAKECATEVRCMHWLSALLTLMSLLFCARPSLAMDGVAPLRDYAIDGWNSRNGLPHNSVRGIVQTAEGYLWFATWEGLVRYDGQEFGVIDRSSRPALPDNGISALYVDPDGLLWLSDSRGSVLQQAADGQFRLWSNQPGWPRAPVHAMSMDADKRMWLLFAGEGLGCLWPDGRFEYLPPPDGGALQSSLPRMVFDDTGRLLIGSLDGLLYRDTDGGFKRLEDVAELSTGMVWPYRASDGTLWVVARERLYQWQDGQAVLMHRIPGQGHFTAMLQDRHGSLWLGSENYGLVRVGAHGVERLGAGHELPVARIVRLFEDAEGSVWVGGNGGLFRLRETLFSNYTRRDGLSSDYSRAVLEDRDGTLWIGSAGGLDRMHADGRIESVPIQSKLGTKPSILSLAQGNDGDLWVGTYADGAFQLRDGRVVQHYDKSDGIPSGHIRAIATGDGEVWLGTQRGVVRLAEGRLSAPLGAGMPQSLITAIANIDGALWVGSVEGASVVKDGNVRRLELESLGGARSVFGFHAIGEDVWIATDRGLYRDRAGRLGRVGLEQGMPVDAVFQLVTDHLGNVWINSNRGVLRLALDNLHKAANGSTHVAVERYDEIDGMANAQANGSSAPSMIRRRDGSIWVVTAGGVATVKPERLRRFRERVAPPVLLKSVALDGRPFSWQQEQEIFSKQRLNISYVGLSYLMPERIQYRTWLEGADPGWIERNTQHSVEFTSLPPGNYALHVSARHPEGQWGPEALWRFQVRPMWWQRRDTQVAAWLLLLLGVIGFNHFMLRRYKTRNERLAKLVRLRTATLEMQTQHLLVAIQEKTELLTRLRLKSEAFERQAHEDALTGLPNRRHFDEMLEREIVSVHRTGKALSLAILDIDHFKLVNDRYTHAVGDGVLREVGAILISACRGSDLPARLGGEEFALLLDNTTLAEAEQVCKRLQEVFHARDNWCGIADLRVTVSMGLAQLRLDESGSELILRADQALYRAKSAGRDRVCCTE